MPIRKTIFFTKDTDWKYKSVGWRELSKELNWLPAGHFKITIEEKTNIRSPEQNNWYWSILNFLEKDTQTWYTADEWHEVFKSEFLKVEKFIPWTDRVYTIQRSTTTLDKFEFTVYIQKIIEFCEQFLNIDRKFLIPKLTHWY